MRLSICSYSFHRLLAAGKQDIFKYITDCKELGCTQLDPWNGHLSVIEDGDAVLRAGNNPEKSQFLSAVDEDYLMRIKAAADKAGLPFGLIAVDGAHIYEATEEARKMNRAKAYRWIDVAHKLGANQIRIDCGGPESMPDDVFKIIKEGYKDVIARGKEKGLQVLIENHWGPSVIPDNVVKLIENIDGLGLLFDTHNWKDRKKEGREKCSKYASATHVKTLTWDDKGNETHEDVPTAVRLLKETGYKGVWGIESYPLDGDETGAIRKAVALVRRLVNN